MDALSLAIENLTSPPVLAFVLGGAAVLLRSDLRLPDPIHTWLSTYLLLAIGLKGGHALKGVDVGDVAAPAAVTLLFGLTVPVVVFTASRAALKVGLADAGSLAAHFGSVSVVTFTAATVLAAEVGRTVEPFMATLVALLEVPGIVVALLIVSMKGGSSSWRSAVREVLTGRSILLLVGGLVMGLVATDDAFARVEPFFVGMFSGLLTLFLLDMGATAMSNLRTSRAATWRTVVFGTVTPLLLGTVGVLVGSLAGLSSGGAGVLGAMVASASYIAAPAAVRIALPEADPGLSLGMALGITFPFNLGVGIPVYFAVAAAVAP